jgi:uncharacterized membrane protein
VAGDDAHHGVNFTWLFQTRCLLAFFLKYPIIVDMAQVLHSPIMQLSKWQKWIAIVVFSGFIGWLLATPSGLLGKADAVAYAVCHRIDSRSFHVGDRQMPLCARCSGMYLGALVGLVFQALRKPRRTGTPPKSVLACLVLLVLAFALDGANSYLSLFPGFPHLYEPQNWLRLATGTGMGLALSAALFPAFNLTVWSTTNPEPAINNLGSFGLVFLAELVMVLFVLTENPLVLYPLALISSAGVLVLLSMVYSMLWIILLRKENQFASFAGLIFPLVAGFGLALFQVAILDLVRFQLLHSWDGFHIGFNFIVFNKL